MYDPMQLKDVLVLSSINALNLSHVSLFDYIYIEKPNNGHELFKYGLHSTLSNVRTSIYMLHEAKIGHKIPQKLFKAFSTSRSESYSVLSPFLSK